MHSLSLPKSPILEYGAFPAPPQSADACSSSRATYTSSAVSFPSPSVPALEAKLQRSSETPSCSPLASAVNSKARYTGNVAARRSSCRQPRWRKSSASQSPECGSGDGLDPKEEQEEYRESTSDEILEGDYNSDEDVADPGVIELQKVFAVPVQHIKESLCQVTELPGFSGETTRRRILGAPMFMSLICAFGWFNKEQVVHALTPVIIDSSKAPDHPFDATDERLRDAAYIFEQALRAPTVGEEERLWTLVINKYSMLKAEWVPDILSRAYGNRGNARSRQGKMEQALDDYDKSIALAPYAVDPVLNRGVVLESLERFDEASADYEAVLHAQPNDPAAWNNLGNVKAAQNNWGEALMKYRKAVDLAPEFSFAAANYALALYQVGRENEALKQFRSLLRKYPEFPDMRAALAVSLYVEGLTAEAENNWQRLQDGRYRDRTWVRNTRRWPPRLANALEAFLDVKFMGAS